MHTLSTLQVLVILGSLCFVTGAIGGIAGALATHLAILPPKRTKTNPPPNTRRSHKARGKTKTPNRTNNTTDRTHAVRVTSNRGGQVTRNTTTDTTPVVTPAGSPANYNIQPSTFVRLRQNERDQRHAQHAA